tara:strand:- start:25267 stop:26634 length:1368 start_codon:yes stop_codon:yes gene_type:complete
VGNLTPLVEHSESPFPHFDSRVAPWLPINGIAANVAMGFIARFDVRDEDTVVVSAGKCVAVDRTGFLLPAGVRNAWEGAAGGTTALEYTAADVLAGIIDLGTGEAVTAPVVYTKTALTLQLQEMGLITNTDSLEDFIGHTCGLARYNYWASAGSDLDNPATFRRHNYKMQDRVAVICDYVVRLPHVPTSAHTSTTVAVADAFVIADLDNGAPGVWGSLATFQTQLDRYDGDVNAEAVGYATGFMPCAKSTDRTPLTMADAATADLTDTVLLRERTSVTALSQDGDFFWDYEVGVLWLFSAGAGAVTGMDPAGGDVISFSDYTTVPAAVTTFAAVVGDIRPGDYLTTDSNSNLCLFGSGVGWAAGAVTALMVDVTNPTAAEWALALNQTVIMSHAVVGQVLNFKHHPVDALDRVRTAYSFLGTQDQMPGSASKGYPDTVTYASAADREVVINLIGR